MSSLRFAKINLTFGVGSSYSHCVRKIPFCEKQRYNHGLKAGPPLAMA